MTGTLIISTFLMLGQTFAPPAAMSSVAIGPALAQPDDPMASEILRDDARLRDVCFVDAQYGWAVGDRGTIWHTENGGKNWRLQRSGVVSPLYTVSFVDRKVGFAAGGFTHPTLHTGGGVLLKTEDGGQTWTPILGAPLPPIKKMEMIDPKHGWAVGSRSTLYTAGAMTTDSGGKTWSPIVGRASNHWLCGAMFDPVTGVVAGRLGQPSVIRNRTVAPTPMMNFGLRSLTKMGWDGPAHGWMVGDGGLILKTNNLGASWQLPSGKMPGSIDRFDLEAVAVLGTNVWVAGSPGTKIFRSQDDGATWESIETGSSIPICDIAFTDLQHGWAVGALGTILATEDGGRTWQRQRGNFRRAAVLAVFPTADDVPWELLAKLGGDEGYLTTLMVVGRRDVETPEGEDSETPIADRVDEAASRLGGTDAISDWRFPLRQRGLSETLDGVVDGWNTSCDGMGRRRLTEQIVCAIRTWRPEIVVTCGDFDPQTRSDSPTSRLVHEAVMEATAQAADSISQVDQLTEMGLATWRVRRLFVQAIDSRGAPIKLTTTRPLTRLGRTVEDMATEARQLVGRPPVDMPETLGFRLAGGSDFGADPLRIGGIGRPGGVSSVADLYRASGGVDEDSIHDFFTGIMLSPGRDARRRTIEASRVDLARLQALARQRRNVRAVIEHTEKTGTDVGAVLGSINQLMSGMDSRGSARLLSALAHRYHLEGRWELADQLYRGIAENYSGTPAARAATIWMLQYCASEETRWREQGAQRIARGTQAGLAIAPPELSEQKLARAVQLGREIERTAPDLYGEPTIRFPLAAARRGSVASQIDRYYTTAVQSALSKAWRDCAAGEQWLLAPDGVAPKAILHCRPVPARPKLDGKLDDPAWQVATVARLTDKDVDPNLTSAAVPAGSTPEVRIAYDAEFLYVAVRVPRHPSVQYPAHTGPRPRDADLSHADRIELMIDIDRDYTTYYRLAVTEGGLSTESLWGDRTWNPQWFIASGPPTDPESQTTPDHWIVEAAIPLEQLTGRPIAKQQVWAIGIQRHIPGVGLQSWNRPATIVGQGEGLGYLIFD